MSAPFVTRPRVTQPALLARELVQAAATEPGSGAGGIGLSPRTRARFFDILTGGSGVLTGGVRPPTPSQQNPELAASLSALAAAGSALGGVLGPVLALPAVGLLFADLVEQAKGRPRIDRKARAIAQLLEFATVEEARAALSPKNRRQIGRVLGRFDLFEHVAGGPAAVRAFQQLLAPEFFGAFPGFTPLVVQQSGLRPPEVPRMALPFNLSSLTADRPSGGFQFPTMNEGIFGPIGGILDRLFGNGSSEPMTGGLPTLPPLPPNGGGFDGFGGFPGPLNCAAPFHLAGGNVSCRPLNTIMLPDPMGRPTIHVWKRVIPTGWRIVGRRRRTPHCKPRRRRRP